MYMISLGWILWHINHCRLFNAELCFYIDISDILIFDIMFNRNKSQ